MEPTQKLSKRAKERLDRALQFLRASPESYGLPAKGWRLDDRNGYYEGIVEALAQLAPAVALGLKVDLDWVEGYEQVETNPSETEMSPDRQKRWDDWIAAQKAGRTAGAAAATGTTGL